MRLHLEALLAAALLGIFPAPRTEAQERPIGAVGITVFEHADYRGRNATFRDEVSDLSDYHLNDRISSFRIAPGEVWEVCEHKDFEGRCAVFSADEPDLSRVSWNETITSLRPIRREPGRDDRERPHRWIVLHDQRFFRGNARELDRPESDLGDFGRRVSSVNVMGRPWELCSRPDFRGRCVVVSEDVADLRSYGIENEVASARPLRRGDGFEYRPEPAPVPRDEPRLILYDRPGFRGRAREVNGSEDELSDFNDRARSVRVIQGAWQLCEHKNFRGRCITIVDDVRDLGAYRLGSAVTSARPID